jgi:hypothetical protein
MGGLVGRAFINDALRDPDGEVAESVRLFVTLSTPWQGQAMAASGVKHAPAVAPSWIDMAPRSLFLRSVHTPPLPPAIPHHLLFSYGGGSRLSGAPSDGVVTLASQLDPSAQNEAAKIHGFNESHTGILSSGAALTLVNDLLAEAAD